VTAARDLFAEKGYAGTTIRAIAGAAGVNPAMVHHFFGSKEQVFVAILNLPLAPSTVVSRVVDGPRGEVGVRMVGLMLEVWRDEQARQAFLALLRAVTTQEQAIHMMRQILEQELLGRIARALGVPEMRLAAASAQVIGLALTRHVIGVEALATAGEQQIIDLVAPVIQYYVDGVDGDRFSGTQSNG
jgi:AcrR family transcriptional regulator